MGEKASKDCASFFMEVWCSEWPSPGSTSLPALEDQDVGALVGRDECRARRRWKGLLEPLELQTTWLDRKAKHTCALKKSSNGRRWTEIEGLTC